MGMSAPPSGAQPSAYYFPDGKWWGSAWGGGEFTGQISEGSGYGAYKFTVEVVGGRVTQGRLTGSAGLQSDAPEGTVNLVLSADVDLGGTANRVEFAGGSFRIQGNVVTDQISAPIDENLPADGGFSPTWASCMQVSGDLAFEGRQIFQAAGGSTNVTMPFIAYRFGGPEIDEELVERLLALVDEMHRVLYEDAPDSRTVVEYDEGGFGRVIYLDESDLRTFLEFAADLEELNGALIRSGECGLAPPGLETGLAADDYFRALFVEALSAYTESTVDMSAAELLYLANLAVRMGVAGAPSPSPETGAEIMDRLEDRLRDRLQQANVAGDATTIRDIATGAEQAGMTELAEEARGLL